MKLCECGCKKEVKIARNGEYRRFFKGHNFKGKKRGKQSQKHIEKCRLLRIGSKRPNQSKALSGRKQEHLHFRDVVKKMGLSMKAKYDAGWKPRIGKKHSKEAKALLRIARIKQIELSCGQCWANYNPKASEYFKSFDQQNNTKGRYALYGDGEYRIDKLGYSLDYINFDIKLIMEYDELKHYNREGKLKQKDLIRQQEIQEFYPDFEFRRIKEVV